MVPPVEFKEKVPPEPTINRFTKLGVSLDPLHKAQPEGMFDELPDHAPIAFTGIEAC